MCEAKIAALSTGSHLNYDQNHHNINPMGCSQMCTNQVWASIQDGTWLYSLPTIVSINNTMNIQLGNLYIVIKRGCLFKNKQTNKQNLHPEFD